MTTILEARNLKVTRGGHSLVDVPELTIFEGETLSLIGPNGAGKTTLLQALSVLTKPSAGQIVFRGRAVGAEQRVLEYRRRIAMVFQEPLLFDTTVLGNVVSGLRIRGIGGKEARRIAESQLERFGIAHLGDRSAKTLSGGEAQRASLARAFAVSPEILFLDEPFASLDPPTREAIVSDLERVLAETGTTTIMATHDRNEALRLSDRIAVMQGGRIAQVDRPTAVMNRPVDEFVASFVGTETILSGRIRENRRGTLAITVNGTEIEAVGEAPPGEEVVLCIRPENVTLAMSGQTKATSARNTFTGRIERIVPMGPYQRVHLDCGFPLVAYVTSQSLDGMGLIEGLQVAAFVKATAIHVIRHGRSPAGTR
ncbi:MAG: ABC transporter ATP-binding protein [Syntrophaceae bacterium]|nr:ABC transporter ATP-binding protein [Syntrophaceae bacterium]